MQIQHVSLVQSGATGKLTIAQWIYQQKGQVDGETNTYYPSLGPPASNVLPPPCPSFKKNNFLQEKQHMVSAALI